MGKDLIIGGASNYTWDDLKYWVNSIQKSGFKGDIALAATNISKDTIKKLASKGVLLHLYGEQDSNGNFVQQQSKAPHVERFLYMWDYLNKTKEKYDYVITTDTRDVVFQTNPSEWLDEHLFGVQHSFVVSSEGLYYKDEPWNNNNMLETFGPHFHNLYRNNVIFNVGTIAGQFETVKDILLMNFTMSINRPVKIVDQAVFNLMISQQPYKSLKKETFNSDAWAIQLGATIEAVKSGKGDLGMSIQQNPSNMIAYQMAYFDQQPELNDDGYVVNKEGKKFCIVHQYDRTLDWKDKIIAHYEQEVESEHDHEAHH